MWPQHEKADKIKILSVTITVCVLSETDQCVVPVNCRASGTAAALAHRTG